MRFQSFSSQTTHLRQTTEKESHFSIYQSLLNVIIEFDRRYDDDIFMSKSKIKTRNEFLENERWFADDDDDVDDDDDDVYVRVVKTFQGIKK
jgi:hypothetical protein